MEKFVTDLDRILDDFENDNITCLDFNSSGYNSLKTSTELAISDIDNSSKLSTMSEIPESLTPTIPSKAIDLIEKTETSHESNEFSQVLAKDPYQSDIIEDSELAYSEDFLDVSNYINFANKNDNVSKFVLPGNALSKTTRKRPSSLMLVNTEQTSSSQLDKLENSNEDIQQTTIDFVSPSSSTNSIIRKRPKTLNLTPTDVQNSPNADLKLISFNDISPNRSWQYDSLIDKDMSCELELEREMICQSDSEQGISDHSESDKIINLLESPINANVDQLTSPIEQQSPDACKEAEVFPINVCSWQGIPIDLLGRQAPIWIPDEQKTNCMECDLLFTVFRRRHHCRACGRLLCSKCCIWKANLYFTSDNFQQQQQQPSLGNNKDRVCATCYTHLVRIEAKSKQKSHYGHPESISTPPTAHAQSNQTNRLITPSSVLKSKQRPKHFNVNIPPTFNSCSDSNNNINSSISSKYVMFADGIRPGGDLTENNNPRIITPTTLFTKTSNINSNVADPAHHQTTSAHSKIQASLVETDIFIEDLLTSCKQFLLPASKEPNRSISVAIVHNITVQVQLINISYCTCAIDTCNCTDIDCWCLISRGFQTLGYHELTILIKRRPNELCPEQDLFRFFYQLYIRAVCDESRKNQTENMLLVLPQPHQKDWPGLLLTHGTYQSTLHAVNMHLACNFGVLVHKWEIHTALHLPLRLLLALGYQSHHYPCSLVNDLSRSPTFYEPAPTILQIAQPEYIQSTSCDPASRIFQGIDNLHIHLLPKQQCIISIPNSAYSNIIQLLSQPDKLTSKSPQPFVLTASFNYEADSHLVCYQDESSYVSKAISIANTEHRVTGATLALIVPHSNQPSQLLSNQQHKNMLGCSIVEDVLVVRVNIIQFNCIVDTLKSMRDLTLEITNKSNLSANFGPTDNNNTTPSPSLPITNCSTSDALVANFTSSILKIVWKEDSHFQIPNALSPQCYYRSGFSLQETLISSLQAYAGNIPDTSSFSNAAAVDSHKLPHSLQSMFHSSSVVSSGITSPRFVWTNFHYIVPPSTSTSSTNYNDDHLPDIGQIIARIACRFIQAINPYVDILRQSEVYQLSLRLKCDSEVPEWSTACKYNNSSNQYSSGALPTVDQLRVDQLPDICLEVLNENFVPFFYSLCNNSNHNNTNTGAASSSVPTQLVAELTFFLID